MTGKEAVHELVLFYPQGHEAHYERGHPERPDRVEAIRLALQAAGWWDPFPRLNPLPLSKDVLQGVHSRDYLNRLKAACRRGEHLNLDSYTTPASWDLALEAAGGAAATAAAVWQGATRSGFALTRPPGHHATPEQGMGFCLLNNIALAAEYLFREEGAQRLAIVDLDLHHGNGTQDIFWRREDVFYISTHQSPLYPGTGSLQETGAGPGEGTTANFPLPPASGDKAYAAVMEKLILPLLDRHGPQMILVSVGFDTHWLDPLGSLQLSAEGYGGLIASLAGWASQHCNGRIALFLEGGYDLEASAACALASVAALLDQPWQDPLGPAPRPEGTTWQSVVRQALQIWGLS
jgi:acetoin utilization deacetylase AcuC-like enzyme